MNSMGFCAVKIHYSADPAKDVQNSDEPQRMTALDWLQQAKLAFPDPNAWAQEMEINWFVASGARVFPEFQESIHASTPLAPNPRKVLYRAWDFGWHAPACLIASIDQKDRLLVLKEVVGKEVSTREFAHRVVKQCSEWFPHHGPGYQDFCDPAGQQARPAAEKSEQKDVEVLASLGIYPSWEYGWSRKDGRSLIHQLLILRTDNTPGFYLDAPGCPTVLQGFLGKYVYPESKDGKAKDEPDEGDHPWADVFAALRYMCTGLYTALGLRRFKYQSVMKTEAQLTHGYGTPVRRESLQVKRG